MSRREIKPKPLICGVVCESCEPMVEMDAYPSSVLFQCQRCGYTETAKKAARLRGRLLERADKLYGGLGKARSGSERFKLMAACKWLQQWAEAIRQRLIEIGYAPDAEPSITA